MRPLNRGAAAVLIKRTLVKDQAYAAYDIDDSAGGALAVAHQSDDGWSVATGAGIVVGTGLGQRRAVSLMLRTAAGPRRPQAVS